MLQSGLWTRKDGGGQSAIDAFPLSPRAEGQTGLRGEYCPRLCALRALCGSSFALGFYHQGHGGHEGFGNGFGRHFPKKSHFFTAQKMLAFRHDKAS